MNLLRYHLRARLLLVALVAVLPAIGLIVYSQAAERRAARARTLADNLRLARLAASQQASLFNGTRRLLLTLAEFPPLRAADPRECLALLPNILRDHPGYFNITVANADGSLFCSGAPIDPRVLASVRARLWFDRVSRTRST